MGYLLKQSQTARPLLFLMVDSTDHVTAKTGLSPTVTISKNGAAFGSPTGAVTELANGWYKVAGNATDTATLGPLVLHATGTAADPSDVEFEIVAFDPEDSVRLGLTALPNVAAGANGGLPTGNASGQTTVGSIAANAITATAINADAITAAKIADGAIDAATFAAGAINAAAIASDAITAAKVADGTIDAATFAAGAINAAAIATDAITAAKIAADAIGASELAADAVTEIQTAVAAGAVASVTGAVGSVTGNVGGNVTGSVGSVVGAVGSVTAAVTITAASVQAIWDALTSALTTVGSIGKRLADNVDVVLSTRAAASALATVQADTDDIQTRLPAALSGGRIVALTEVIATDAVDAAAIKADAATEIATAVWASGTRTLTSLSALLASIAGAVWDELIAGHLGAGSTGAALNAAGSAGDPWTTALPGAYGAGTAGFIVGTDLDGTISSRASAAALATVQADTDDIQSRLPAALVGGKIDASVGALGTGAITSGTFAAGAIDAAAIATDAIGSAELAASAVTEIQGGLATAAALVTAQADLDDIQTRLPAALVSGRIDASVGAMAADVVTANAIQADAIGSSELAATAVSEIATGVRTELATELARVDAAVSSRASQTSLDTVDDLLDTEILALTVSAAAIKAKTDLIPATPAAVGSAMTIDPAQALANGQVAGTVGYALVAAEVQGAGDWILAGTVLTLKRKNGTVFATFTLDDADAPTQRIA